MVGVSNTCDHIRSAAWQRVLQPCCGGVHREPYVTWATSIVLGHPITTCWGDGESYNLLFHLPLLILLSPTLVANLWDVTDKDIDKLSQSVFDKIGLGSKELDRSKEKCLSPMSLIAAVAQSRDSCKLKYLTGAAPVVYGIPFYL